MGLSFVLWRKFTAYRNHSRPSVVRQTRWLLLQFFLEKFFGEKSMHQAIATIRMTSPYVQSRFHNTAKLNKEKPALYEERTWRQKAHTTEVDGVQQIVIPGMVFANCIKDAARFLSIRIQGEGASTWTKHFESGILVTADVLTGVPLDAVRKQDMFVSATGKTNGGTRVTRSFPLIHHSQIGALQVKFHIVDEKITDEVFAHHLQQSGLLIGIGAFRVRNRGTFGRFHVESIDWVEGYSSGQLPEIRRVSA